MDPDSKGKLIFPVRIKLNRSIYNCPGPFLTDPAQNGQLTRFDCNCPYPYQTDTISLKKFPTSI